MRAKQRRKLAGTAASKTGRCLTIRTLIPRALRVCFSVECNSMHTGSPHPALMRRGEVTAGSTDTPMPVRACVRA